jgi:hypothetical protein
MFINDIITRNKITFNKQNIINSIAEIVLEDCLDILDFYILQIL